MGATEEGVSKQATRRWGQQQNVVSAPARTDRKSIANRTAPGQRSE